MIIYTLQGFFQRLPEQLGISAASNTDKNTSFNYGDLLLPQTVFFTFYLNHAWQITKSRTLN